MLNDNNLDDKTSHLENEKHSEEELKKHKSNGVKTIIISIMIAIGIIFTINGAIDVIYSSYYSYDEDEDDEDEDYSAWEYAVKFIEEYQIAKDNYLDFNKVKVDDYGRVIFNGEELYGDDTFSIKITNTYFYRYDYDIDSYLRCIDFPVASKRYDGICAMHLLEDYDVNQFNSPEDFVKALAKNNIKLKDKYLVKNTKHKIIYSIKGFTFSQEYIDLVKSWLKNDGFK